MLSPRDIQQSQLATHEWCLFFGLMSTVVCVTVYLVQTCPHQIEFLVFVLVINQAESWFQDILQIGREFTAVNVWLLQRSRIHTREWAEGPPRVLPLSGAPARLWACLAVGPCPRGVSSCVPSACSVDKSEWSKHGVLSVERTPHMSFTLHLGRETFPLNWSYKTDKGPQCLAHSELFLMCEVRAAPLEGGWSPMEGPKE